MAQQNPSPKHGPTDQSQQQASKKSVSQADGTAANDPKGATNPQAQPSGSEGQDPSTAGKSNAPVRSQTPEHRQEKINPSAPTEGTEGARNDLSKQFASAGPSTMDSAGETGTQSGKGTLEVDELHLSSGRTSTKKDMEREFTGKESGRRVRTAKAQPNSLRGNRG